MENLASSPVAIGANRIRRGRDLIELTRWVAIAILSAMTIASPVAGAETYGNLVLQDVKYVVTWGLSALTEQPLDTIESGSVTPDELPKQVDFAGPTKKSDTLGDEWYDTLGDAWCFRDYVNDISMSGSTTFNFPNEMPYVYNEDTGFRLTTTPTFTLSTNATFNIANSYGCEMLMRINYSEREAYFETTTTSGREGSYPLTLNWSGFPEQQLGETFSTTEVFFKIYAGAVSYYGDYLKRYILLTGKYRTESTPNLVQIQSITPAPGTKLKPGEELNFDADVLYQRSEDDRLSLKVVYRDEKGDFMQEFSGPAVDTPATSDGILVYLTNTEPTIPLETDILTTIDVYAEFENHSAYDWQTYEVATDELSWAPDIFRGTRDSYGQTYYIRGTLDYRLETTEAAQIFLLGQPHVVDTPQDVRVIWSEPVASGEATGLVLDVASTSYETNGLSGVDFWLMMQSTGSGEILAETEKVFVGVNRSAEMMSLLLEILLSD